LQVLAVYLVGAWLALQIADVAVLPAFGIAGIGMRYLVIAAAAGLVIAFALSWRYELGAQGIRRHQSRVVEDSASVALTATDRWTITALATAATLIMAATTLKLAGLAGTAGPEHCLPPHRA
jgi:hypothetical protein